MLLKWFLCAAVFNFSPVYAFSKNLTRHKRSDDFISCEKGWYEFREKCYKAEGIRRSEKLNWEKAEARCNAYGGNLVSIGSKEELDFVVTYPLFDIKHHVHIGLHDRDSEGNYTWTDGSPYVFKNWRPHQPSGTRDGEEDCGEMNFEPEDSNIGLWNDLGCQAELAYICQKKKSETKKSPDPRYCSEEIGGWKFQNSCYHVVSVTKSWESAEKYCKDNYNGHLLTINGLLEDMFLDYILADMKQKFWIGIKLKDQLQQKWTSGWHVAYNGFTRDIGDFVEETCVVRNKRKDWSTAQCNRKYQFICEISEDIPPVLKPAVKGSHCPEIPNDWRDLEGEYCYFIETKKHLNWFEASYECRRRGSHLISVHSKEEGDILLPFIKYERLFCYTGLIRLMGREDVFEWSDGSEIDYLNWAPTEPNKVEEKCVELSTRHMMWNDYYCHERRGYICKVKKISPNTTTAVEKPECVGHVSFKVLIGVSVCIIILIILVGVVMYYFRPCEIDRRRKSPAIPMPPISNRPKYRSEMEIAVKDDENYEIMY